MKWNRGNDVAVLVVAVLWFFSIPHAAGSGLAGLFGELVGSLIGAIILVFLGKLVWRGIDKLRGAKVTPQG